MKIVLSTFLFVIFSYLQAAFKPELIGKIDNVHGDDIHGISVLNTNLVVSGSKDTTVKLFDLTSRTSSLISSNPRGDYRHWVTGIDAFEEGSVVVGHRNGYLLCKQALSGEKFFAGFPCLENFSVGGRGFYKQRNERRITAVKCLKNLDFAYSALVGFPEQFYHFDFDKKKVVGFYKFDSNDWVYGFCNVSSNRVATIHGCCLSMFSFYTDMGSSQWELISPLVKPARERYTQKPFISSVFAMDRGEEKKILVLSFFGGKTRVLDIEAGKFLHETEEHSGRVWQSLPLSESEYISCADDSTVKIWDMRCGQSSIKTYSGHPGRVSAIGRLDEYRFIAGTCPENPHESSTKAEFYIYDIRMDLEEHRKRFVKGHAVAQSLEDLGLSFSGLALEESLMIAQRKGDIGPRSIPEWELEDVEDQGNCFYDAVGLQMEKINHSILSEKEETTLLRDLLRSRVQGEQFQDLEWADHRQIDSFVKIFDVILAVADTRTPEDGFTYYFLEDGEVITKIPESSEILLPQGKQVLKIATTGNHFLSVVNHP